MADLNSGISGQLIISLHTGTFIHFSFNRVDVGDDDEADLLSNN